MFYSTFAAKQAAARRRQTLAERKADQGCDCHGLDLLLCPNYRPAVFKTKANGFEYTAKVITLGARPAFPSATVRLFEVGRA